MGDERNGKAAAASKAGGNDERIEDSAIRSLSKDEIKRLSIDAWEPSLLRHLLEAQNKLRRRR